jgi:hypothetical protein
MLCDNQASQNGTTVFPDGGQRAAAKAMRAESIIPLTDEERSGF